MKCIKLIFSLSVLLVALTLTSCLDSDSSKQPYQAYVTVEDGGMTLLTDDGYTLYPSDYSGFSSLERAYVVYTLQDGYTNDGSVLHVDIDTSQSFGIYTKSVIQTSAAIDSLENKSLTAFNYMWAANGYVTTNVSFMYQNKAYFDLIRNLNKESNDTLYLKFNFNKGDADGYYSAYSVNSFRLPGGLRYDFSGKDSIVVAVSANVNSETKTFYSNYKFNY